ncbi:SDR family oxidoreductase [Neolewinella aurantiaca]|uniref:SDR family oxidoreductase n=1 Tax=Neolewinella aurantiaca TaxID=2602767 RepID=A0A5C7FX66_9BACT|nr:SDR family oxidoreductase [Neolewinella aurantiaca]TXF89536.1 SDR family oxidoreductase [Neolewinella aurantiaca]
MQNFRNKVVVITGAGSGIGRELARQLAREGAIFVLNDWNQDSLMAIWEELPEAARGYMEAFDVGDRQAVEGFAGAARKALGRIDVVFNNAGLTQQITPVIYGTIEDYEKILQVNLWGVIYGSLAFLPHLREHGDGCLVNISSVFGLMGCPGQAPYCVSKFGVRGFTETLRVEMRGTGLQVVCVHPGGIKTNIARHALVSNETDHERFVTRFDKLAKTTASQAAEIIISGIKRGKSRITIGSDARLIDKITRLMPESYERILQRSLDRAKFLRPR